MAQLQAPINTAGIDTSASFDMIPDGWYQAIIIDSDESANKNGDGRWILLEFVIGSGPHSGKKIKTWLNYQHKSAKAQEIALKQLAKIMEVLRVPSPLKDTSQLHNKKIEIQISINGTYNNVDDFRACAITQSDMRAPAPADTNFSDMEEPEWAKS